MDRAAASTSILKVNDAAGLGSVAPLGRVSLLKQAREALSEGAQPHRRWDFGQVVERLGNPC